MKKLMFVATAALIGAMVSGCASTGGNPIAEWQESRFKAAEIAAVKDKGKLPQLADVQYVSLNHGNGKCAVLAVPIDAVAPVPAALYLQVVIGVDELMATEAGRSALVEYNNLAKGNEADGVKPMSKEEILAKWAEDDKTALANLDEAGKKSFKGKLATVKEYRAFLNNAKPDTLIPLINEIVNVQIPKALEDVSKTVQSVLDDAKSGKLKVEATGMELLGGLSNTGKDGAALAQQLKDTGVGAAYWLKLAMADKAAKDDLASLDAILSGNFKTS